MMQALELLQDTSQGTATLDNEEIKPVAIANIVLCLSEHIIQPVSQSVRRSSLRAAASDARKKIADQLTSEATTVVFSFPG